MRPRLVVAAAALVSSALLGNPVSVAAQECSAYSADASAESYWASVAGCVPCVTSGCTYCLATFTCGEDAGGTCAPEDLVSAGEPGQCPGEPQRPAARPRLARQRRARSARRQRRRRPRALGDAQERGAT
jgi:hypothetical protein